MKQSLEAKPGAEIPLDVAVKPKAVRTYVAQLDSDRQKPTRTRSSSG